MEPARCFRCGDTGHLRAQCPSTRPVPVGGAPEGRANEWDKPVPRRRPPEEVADYEWWAAAVRQANGWGSEDIDRQQLALTQVDESRRLRSEALDGLFDGAAVEALRRELGNGDGS